jgi:hypothetical protein
MASSTVFNHSILQQSTSFHADPRSVFTFGAQINKARGSALRG